MTKSNGQYDLNTLPEDAVDDSDSSENH